MFTQNEEKLFKIIKLFNRSRHLGDVNSQSTPLSIFIVLRL